jgi:hypothetical protein
MSRENLIPALTVDKNGKTTTVYRKHESVGSGAAAIPAPSMPSARDLRQKTIDGVWREIEEGIHRFQIPSYKDKMTDIYRNLSGTRDEDYPDLVLETVSKLVPAAVTPSAVRAILITVANGDENVMRAMHDHSDYLAANPQQIAQFTPMVKMLDEKFGIKSEAGKVPLTIEAHLYAKSRFEDLTRTHNVLGVTGEEYYRNCPDVVRIVEKHPNEVHELMNYLTRGQEVASMEEFEEYLAQGALREGTL